MPRRTAPRQPQRRTTRTTRGRSSAFELGLVQGPTRPNSEYTAKQRRRAIDSARNGNLRDAADLTLAAITENGTVRGVLSTLTYGLWGLPVNFTGPENMVAALRGDAKVPGSGDWAVMFPQDEMAKLLQWGLTLGVALGQMVPRPFRSIGDRDVRILKAWNPRDLRYQAIDDTWWLRTANKGEIQIHPGDGEWFLFTPFGRIEPWEFGHWKMLTLGFVLSRDSVFDRARHAEILAPVRVGKVPQGSTEKQRQKYADLIERMQRFNYFTLPPGYEYDIIESKGTGRITDVYKAIIDWADNDVKIGLTGQTVTTDGTAGFSNGSIHQRIARDLLKFYVKAILEAISAQVLPWWALRNFSTLTIPGVTIDADPPEDKKARAETTSAAAKAHDDATASMAKHGMRPTQESVKAYWQGLGFDVEPLPAASVSVSKLDLAPTDLAKAVRTIEARASQGLPALGDDRDNLMLSQLDAPPPANGTAPAPSMSAGSTAATEVPMAVDDNPRAEEAARLAAKMTERGVDRCWHNRVNVCDRCGIERINDFDVGPDGAPVWKVEWRAIAPPKPVAPAAPVEMAA